MKRASLVALPAALLAVAMVPDAHAATRSLDDYRHFRALSIDLVGRIPTLTELAAFEADSFDVNAWVTAQLKGPAYVNRMRQIYMDLLRVQVGSAVQFVPQPSRLKRVSVIGPDGKPMYVYYRGGQRRTRLATDGDFCLTPGEAGIQMAPNATPLVYPFDGTQKTVLQTDLNTYTKVIKPWWLYADYTSTTPTDLYGASWATAHPGFVPVAGLQLEPDGVTPTTEIRVCNEETQEAESGTIFAPANPGKTYPPGRLIALPTDSSFAKNNKGAAVSCTVQLGGNASADCGCGVGLERCLPGTSNGFDPASFNFTTQEPIGLAEPTDATDQAGSSWHRAWWGEEAAQFLGYVFSQDKDFREVLTGHYSLVNGPMAQFYKHTANNTCCGNAVNLPKTANSGPYTTPVPLFDPAQIPDINPTDTQTWKLVTDRGPNASGILTMPVFLTKFGSRRARAHVLYNAFKCQDFIAGNIELTPSTEPNLMIRPGCSTCHATLEPLASYYSRVMENDWTFLPPESFPVMNASCGGKIDAGLPSNGNCTNYYDPAFETLTMGTLRGAYPDTFQNGTYAEPTTTHHADDGPAGLAQHFITDPDFPGCVAQNVAAALLGRQLTPDDAGFKEALAATFVQGGYKMSALVQAVVTSPHYASANNFTSTQWRKENGQ
jgi:hypothetical protein